MCDGLPEYSDRVQGQLNIAYASHRVRKRPIENQHRVMGALVRKGEVSDKELRDFEKEVFDPELGRLAKIRDERKREILRER